MSEVDNRKARLGEVPIDKGDRSPGAPDRVPWDEVAVADDISRCPSRRTCHPDRVRCRHEPPLSVVTGPEQRPEPLKPAVLEERRGTRAHAGATLYERKDLVIALDADDARCAFEPCPFQMAKEGMDSDGPPPLPSVNSVANPHRLGERAARQRHSAVHGSHRSQTGTRQRARRSASKGEAIVVAYSAAAAPPVGRHRLTKPLW